MSLYPSLVLVQPRKTRPCLTERLLVGRKESNQTNMSFNSYMSICTVWRLWPTRVDASLSTKQTNKLWAFALIDHGRWDGLSQGFILHTLILCHTLGRAITNQHTNAFADPWIFVRGVQVNQTKKALTPLFFLVHSLFYRSQLVNFKENYHFSRFQRGSNIFQGGGGLTFAGGGGGSNCLFPIETHITCDFSGGRGGGLANVKMHSYA